MSPSLQHVLASDPRGQLERGHWLMWTAEIKALSALGRVGMAQVFPCLSNWQLRIVEFSSLPWGQAGQGAVKGSLGDVEGQ